MNLATISPLISEEEISKATIQLGKEITEYYSKLLDPNNKDDKLIVICVLKGAFVFCADLIRNINTPLSVEFLSVSSYGEGTESSKNVILELDTRRPLEGKHVLVVEDIIDTGHSIKTLLEHLHVRDPLSLKFCTLLSKPSRREISVPIDFLGFEIPNLFVIGYGLDYDEKYRELPFIGVLNQPTSL